MKKILITGYTGFIGRNISEYLKNKVEKYNIVTPTRKELDLINEKAVTEFLKIHKFDIVIHCAVSNDKKKLLEDTLRMFMNFEKNNDLFERMICLGSGAEYDKRDPIVSVEEVQIGERVPVDHYGLAKYIINTIINESSNIYNLRLFGIYGKHEKITNKFISNICCKAIKNLPLSIKQNVYFDYLYIDDFCKILDWFIENKPKYHDYNVVNGKPIDLQSLAETVVKISGKNLPIYICREGLANEYTADNSRLIDEIGDFHYTPHEEAIRQLYQWNLKAEHNIDLLSLLYTE